MSSSKYLAMFVIGGNMALAGGIYGLMFSFMGLETGVGFLLVIGITGLVVGIIGVILLIIGAQGLLTPSPYPNSSWYYPPPGAYPPPPPPPMPPP